MLTSWLAISNPEEDSFGEVYNVGNGVNYSVNEVAAMISDNTVNIPRELVNLELLLLIIVN